MRPPTPRLDNSPISRGDEWPAGPFRAAPLTLCRWGHVTLGHLWYLHQDGILSQVVLLSKVIAGISILMYTHAKYVLKIGIFRDSLNFFSSTLFETEIVVKKSTSNTNQHSIIEKFSKKKVLIQKM